MLLIDLHKFAGVIFRITQIPLYTTPSTLIISYITNKEIFVKWLRNLMSDWSLVPDLLWF